MNRLDNVLHQKLNSALEGFRVDWLAKSATRLLRGWCFRITLQNQPLACVLAH